MPLPRFQPVRKKQKVTKTGPSLEDLNDKILSCIIGHALSLSKLRDEEPFVGDNSKTERNLSLVSKRWFFLTQIQINEFGVHQINLDNALSRSKPDYDIKLYRIIRPKLMKYKHIQIRGSVTIENFIKLMIAMNSAKIQRLDVLKLNIESTRAQFRSKLSTIPERLNHLETLTITCSTETVNGFASELMWKIYERASRLQDFQVYLIGGGSNVFANNVIRSKDASQGSFLEMLHILASSRNQQSHRLLSKLTFNMRQQLDVQSMAPIYQDYSELVKFVLSMERTISQFETNDFSLIEHLIKSSERLCTKHDVRHLKFSAPINDMEFLSKLIKLQNLGTDYLSVAIDDIELMADVLIAIESYKSFRGEHAKCRVNLYLKDQKVPDCEDKVKTLTNLSRLANVYVHISALQRISIDCCHLMWSIGRALQASANYSNGACIFRITLQTYPIKPNVTNPCEITIPFGKCSQYKINSMREDLTRHREIMRALKRDCYHQFVKSVRDNITN